MGLVRGKTARWAPDAAAALAFTLAGLVGGGWHRSDWGPIALLLVTLPIAGLRWWPMACFAIQLAGTGLLGPLSGLPPVAAAALALGGFAAVGVSGRWPRLMAAFGAIGVVTLMHFSPGSGSRLLWLVAAWLLVLATRSLWLRSQSAEQEAQALRREHAATRALAVQTERARIARELHDVLGHNVSVMMIQAGAARHVADSAVAAPGSDGMSSSDRSLVSAALQEVEAAGRCAMSELRQLLDVLGADPPEDGAQERGLAPQPGLKHLDPLLERVRAAGLPVSLTMRGMARSLEPGLDLAAYRVIQEGLTNVLKHSGGAKADVVVAYEQDGVNVTVRDWGRAADADASEHDDRSEPGADDHGADDGRDVAGRGLLGLRERVALYHGEFEAGRTADGGYRVHARFPGGFA